MKPVGTSEIFGSLQTLISRTNDPKTAADLSPEIFIKTGKDGKVVLYKVPQKDVSDKVKKTYMANAKSQQARELAGKKIEDALKHSGVQITANIRQALPSKTNMGDFKSLQSSFAEGKLKLHLASNATATQKKAPVSETQVLSAVKQELAALNWSDPRCVTTLFRSTSDGQTKITDYLAGTFTQSVEKCVANAVQSALLTLKETGSQDEALLALNKAVLQGLGEVRFTPEFNQLAFKLLELTDQVASEKQTSGPGVSDDAVVGTIAKEIKSKLLATIFLRTLSLDLGQSLAKVDNQLKDAVKVATGRPPEQGFKPTKVGALVQTLFSGATDIDKKVGDGTGIKEGMPKYYAFAFNKDENNLSGFTALTEFRKSAGIA